MNNRFGKEIRRAREEAKPPLSIRGLADRVKISSSYLSDIEHGRRIPAEDVMRSLARVLGFDLVYLFSISGTISLKAETYLKGRPEAVELVHVIAKARLTRDELRDLIVKVVSWR